MRLLWDTLLYILNLVVDIYTPRAKMQAKLLVLPNSLSEPQLQLNSQSLTLATRSQKNKKSNKTERYIQGNLPSFSESVSSVEKNSMTILGNFGYLATSRLALAFRPQCSRLYAYISDCTLHFLSEVTLEKINEQKICMVNELVYGPRMT